MPAAQSVFLSVMFAALLLFALFWVLFWMGLAVEWLMLGSIGVVGMATGLNFIGEGLWPHWKRTRWKPPPGGRATVLVGRLSSLGIGIWFGTGGVAFLGFGWLTEHILPGILGAFAAGFGLVMVGMWDDRRRA